MSTYDGSAADDRSDYTSSMAASKQMGTMHKGIETSTAGPPKSAVSSKPGHGTGRQG